MKKVNVLGVAALAAGVGLSGVARAEGFELSLGADAVSSYVWRGALCGSAAIQPALGISYGGFSLGAWGSTDIAGLRLKELDLSVGYSIGNLSLAITDYWWNGEGSPYGFYKHSQKYSEKFGIDNGHLFEGAIGYSIGNFSASWSTFFLGDKIPDLDKEGALQFDGETGIIKMKEQFSTFIEASYAFDVKGISFTPSIGIVPWKSMYHKSHDNSDDDRSFTLATVSFTASKELKVTESFSLPVFTQLVFAPELDNAFLVFGLSF
ncbi:MAG: hypothetical protein LBU03_05510 [Tannerellaceae bacterium]|jgi:hypothetical protein|nr:hypothetical protein [Tannerellaceae bacterium]